MQNSQEQAPSLIQLARCLQQENLHIMPLQPARKQQKAGKSYDAEQPGTGTQLDPAGSLPAAGKSAYYAPQTPNRLQPERSSDKKEKAREGPSLRRRRRPAAE
jgi:hypothetical protein